jgi:hypothetical protein
VKDADIDRVCPHGKPSRGECNRCWGFVHWAAVFAIVCNGAGWYAFSQHQVDDAKERAEEARLFACMHPTDKK